MLSVKYFFYFGIGTAKGDSLLFVARPEDVCSSASAVGNKGSDHHDNGIRQAGLSNATGQRDDL